VAQAAQAEDIFLTDRPLVAASSLRTINRTALAIETASAIHGLTFHHRRFE
jgi:hypothetical protein